MAESSETPPPRAPFRPNSEGFLPRIRHSEPDPADPPPASATSKPDRKVKPPGGREEAETPRSKAKGRPAKDEAEAPEKGVETPILETHEGRRKVRIAVGLVTLAVLSVLGYNLIRAIGGGDSEVVYDPAIHPELDLRAPTAAATANVDLAAGQMFQQARLVSTNGNTAGAVSLLEKLIESYPNSGVAKEAREALGRPARNLPLFVDGDALVAEKADAPPATSATPPPDVVEATAPAPPPTTSAGTTAEVSIAMATSPAEPRQPNASTLQATPEAAARPLPPGFQARPEAGVHASGWPLEIVGDRDGATMVLVPGATFTMGRDDGPASEGPAHQVTLTTYYIDQHEVTVRQYARYQLESGQVEKEPRSADANPDLPVVRVTANEALAFARWAGKYLPTEAQWEMAARTPDGRNRPWGTGPVPWETDRAIKQIDPVMSFPGDLSPYGVYDLAGNAWEWTSDWYDATYYRQLRATVAVDPTGAARGRSRTPQLTIKGGSRDWLGSWREPLKIDARLPHLGFRCALPVERPVGPAPAQDGVAPATGGVIPF